MKKNKRILVHILTFVFLLAIFTAPVVFAANNVSTGPTSEGKIFKNPLGANATLQGFLKSILKVVTMLGAIVVVFFIIFAGFNYVTARGDEKKIQAATKTFTWTAVGAAVILGAQVIANAIEGTVRQLGTGSN